MPYASRDLLVRHDNSQDSKCCSLLPQWPFSASPPMPVPICCWQRLNLMEIPPTVPLTRPGATSPAKILPPTSVRPLQWLWDQHSRSLSLAVLPMVVDRAKSLSPTTIRPLRIASGKSSTRLRGAARPETTLGTLEAMPVPLIQTPTPSPCHPISLLERQS